MRICHENKCTGCSACLNVCTQRAITMEKGKGGFLYPVINEDLCIKCGQCVKICPTNHHVEMNKNIKVYAALAKKDEIRAKSTSGGIFYCIAHYIIKNNGVVFGAKIDSDLSVKHIEVDNEEGLNKLRGSKYLQSEIGNCFFSVKNRLEEGRIVLFSGTPCQVAGLRNFLGKEYPKLFVIDILCHGVPAPIMFEKYKLSEEKRANAIMTEIRFRTKKIGWKRNVTVRKFGNYEATWPDTFVPGFLSDLFLRDSCYLCQYAQVNRIGDITLGDFWGYQESSPENIEDDDLGISLVLVNSEKGKKIMKKIKYQLALAERTLDEARKEQLALKQPSSRPVNYCEFWENAEYYTWDELQTKYFKKQNINEWMTKEGREYYSQPFVRRHRKHQVEFFKQKIMLLIRQKER